MTSSNDDTHDVHAAFWLLGEGGKGNGHGIDKITYGLRIFNSWRFDTFFFCFGVATYLPALDLLGYGRTWGEWEGIITFVVDDIHALS